MRDAHRMKERLDLSLDNRQVVSLLIGGIVVLGAVFVLGVVVGKKLSTSETAGAAPDLLTALDQKAAAMQEVRNDPPLTFQDELTKKTPALAIAPPAPKPEPAKVEVAKVEPAKVEPAVVQPAKAEVAAVEAAAKVEPAMAEARDVKAEIEKALAMGEKAGQVDEAPVPTRSAATDGGLKDAFARAQGGTPAKPPAEAKAGGAWTLQLSASQSRDEADRFAANVRNKGYAPFVIKAEVPGRGTWYRVRMGAFPSKEAASRYLQDFKRETQLDAFVASAN